MIFNGIGIGSAFRQRDVPEAVATMIVSPMIMLILRLNNEFLQ